MRFYKSLIAFITLAIMLSGCEVIGAIFEAGVWIGIIIAIIIALIIMWIIRKMKGPNP